MVQCMEYAMVMSSTARSRRMRTCGMSTRAMRRRTTLQRACLVSNRKRPRMRRGAGTPPPCVASAAEAAAELHVAPRALELSVPGRFATLRVRLPAPVVDLEELPAPGRRRASPPRSAAAEARGAGLEILQVFLIQYCKTRWTFLRFS